jgi:transcription elongation factor GreA
MDQIPVTKIGFERLEKELHDLKFTQRPAVIEAIATAREHGDLSENAEYHAAREQQSFIEGRIQELDAVTGRAQIIDPTTLSGDSV